MININKPELAKYHELLRQAEGNNLSASEKQNILAEALQLKTKLDEEMDEYLKTAVAPQVAKVEQEVKEVIAKKESVANVDKPNKLFLKDLRNHKKEVGDKILELIKQEGFTDVNQTYHILGMVRNRIRNGELGQLVVRPRKNAKLPEATNA